MLLLISNTFNPTSFQIILHKRYDKALRTTTKLDHKEDFLQRFECNYASLVKIFLLYKVNQDL